MSLNRTERHLTAVDLQRLRALIPLSDQVLARRLGYASTEDLATVLTVDGRAHPAEVWRVRDFLVAVAQGLGVNVPPFAVLKDSKRTQAEGWFGTWDVPSVQDL